jgi:UDP:flavonoid glycosyltransferase YjiC (YdhE family)
LARPFVDPAINALHRDYGLPEQQDHFFRSSPQFNLHLYSPAFAPLPPDWTGPHRQTGFCFWDQSPSPVTDNGLEAFLQAGRPPWLVTLGSAVVACPGSLYAEAAAAFAGTERRAIFLIGHERNRPALVPDNVLITPYASYSHLMPRCAGVIHQCGIGTTAQSLRAGLPSVACPYAFEQPNNAARLVRLGVARLLPESRRRAKDLRKAMEHLEQSSATTRARTLGDRLREEAGAEDSAELLEHFVRAHACPV